MFDSEPLLHALYVGNCEAAQFWVLSEKVAQTRAQDHRSRKAVEGLQLPKLEPPPRFFVSIDSKRVRVSVSALESTLMGEFVSVDSVDSKEVTGAMYL